MGESKGGWEEEKERGGSSLTCRMVVRVLCVLIELAALAATAATGGEGEPRQGRF